ncbi:small-conductance mechanosensitive channel [Breznakia sp. PF5-3]|uniref:hypothetical protein n=1 Tax=unclassified Breznakia TaxID=2623764 RepID=UPI002406D832|nr:MULTISPECIES: hypothetical protein [unclassified Breznakia]MDF9825202.1 small-conductance mechanosensitive channel [Breznakia sp. PM6-1]MDF9836060.1 small-conductance mechanosensitive channel [Breznakia sp. PF5-3]MDF9838876.1 small-conductance mechanosensitive channel [Breznakia sp. PFB2-8]MDF9860902.1 small-conductance mechanosensitive channel [Breznakia sp. PH5-24]
MEKNNKKESVENIIVVVGSLLGVVIVFILIAFVLALILKFIVLPILPWMGIT